MGAVPAQAAPSWQRWVKAAPPVLGVVLLLVAVAVVRREFRHLRLEAVAAALAQIPHRSLWLAAVSAVAAYVVLTLYDLLGSIYAGHRLPYRRIAFASFCAYALSHNLGVSALSGGAVRFRLYAGWGFTPLQVGKLVGFCSLTFGFGGMVIGGTSLLLFPHAVPFFGPNVPHWLLRAAGGVLLSLVAAYWALAALRRDVALFGQTLSIPNLPMAVLQVVLATSDVSTAALVFYWLLPHGQLGYFHFLAIYVICYSAGVVASLPGGIGVFDSAMLLALSPYAAAPRIVGTIVVFRLLYYVIPLVLAGCLFSAHEILLQGRAHVLGRVAPAVPAVLRRSESDFAIAAGAGVVALCGTMLLGLGVVAPTVDRGWIDPDYVSNVAGVFVPSLIGAALLVSCIGLAQRVRLAWGGTLVLLLLGAVLTLAGPHWRFAPPLLALGAFVLAPYRGAFFRRARLSSGPLQVATVLPLLALVGCVLSLSVFERHVRFVSRNSFWHVVSSPLVPLSVRLAVGLSVLVGLVALWRLLIPGRAQPVAWSMETRVRFGMLGGKPPAKADGLIWGEAGGAALPFRRLERLLVGLGDPAGDADDTASAVWRLREIALREGRAPAIYRAGTVLLDVYGALGLVAFPLGGDGLPLTEAGEPAAFLLCRDERDLAALMPVLPELAGWRISQAA